MSDPQTSVEILHDGDVTIETLVNGTGASVVMLPSLGRDGYTDFDETAGLLVQKGFKVLRPQPRGIGQSSGPMVGVDLHDFARDVATVIRRLSDGPAIVVGHAYGNFVARTCAMNHGSFVRGVVLAASAASDTSSRFPEIWASPGIAADTSLSTEHRLAALRAAFFAPDHNPEPWLEGWYPRVHDMQLAGVLPMAEWWSAGAAPLLELIPEEDPFKPRDRWVEMRARFGERVTTTTIPGASHALFPEEPRAVASALAAWARQLPS